MDKKVLSNYFYNVLYQIAKNALSIIIVPYVMGTLGESVLGVSDFASNIASWFILFGILGINVYGNREIAKVRDDKQKLSKVFFEILLMQVSNMSIALVAYFLFSKSSGFSNITIYYLTCISIVANAIDISWFFFGIENFKIVSIRNIVIKVLGVAMIMLFVKKPSDLWKYVVINGCGDLLGNIAMYFGLRNRIEKVRINIIDAYKNHFVQTFILFVPTIASSIYNLLDQTMLGFIIEDKGEVALYKTAHSFVKIFLYFTTSLGAVLLPRIANTFYKDHDYSKVSTYINTSLKYTLLIAIPMTFGFFFVSPYFIPWYLPNQLQIIKLIQFSCPIITLISISNVFGYQFLIPTGHNKQYSTSLVIGACTNAIANAISIPKFYGIGAAVGSVIAEFMVMFTQLLYARNRIKVNIFANLFKYLLSSVAMSIIVVVIGSVFGSSVVVNLVQAVLGVVTYVVVLLLLKEEMVISLKNRVFSKIQISHKNV